MDSDAPTEVASVLQSASINRHPSPRHDVNPSTAASQKQPVRLNEHPDPDASDVEEDEIPLSVLDPLPRHKAMPPLPDLRFEQSYLKSIEHAEGWQGVLWITLRDQVALTRRLFIAIHMLITNRSSCASPRAYYGPFFLMVGDTGTDRQSSADTALGHGYGDGGGASITGRYRLQTPG